MCTITAFRYITPAIQKGQAYDSVEIFIPSMNLIIAKGHKYFARRAYQPKTSKKVMEVTEKYLKQCHTNRFVIDGTKLKALQQKTAQEAMIEVQVPYAWATELNALLQRSQLQNKEAVIEISLDTLTGQVF